MRNNYTLFKTAGIDYKSALLNWSKQYSDVVWLDSNQTQDDFSTYQGILAVDAFTALSSSEAGGFDALQEYLDYTQDWVFGYLTYDLKNDVEALTSAKSDELQFPAIQFFRPKKIIILYADRLEFLYLNMVQDELEDDLASIQVDSRHNRPEQARATNALKIQLRTSKDTYFERFKTLKQHIQRGDIFEVNYCQEFFSKSVSIDPLATFLRLNAISKAPFATYANFGSHYCLSASPERYLKKQGDTLYSQPIKGTAKRGSTQLEDAQIIQELLNNKKERSENIMITDLVRNDLSKTAVKDSVTVLGLCELHSFEQVHQLVSTVTSKVPPTLAITDIFKTTFPMGSMTGAPKVSAMEISEQVEDFKRGLYSGAIGYITPEGDFDFNVVIRSILYNAATNYVSYAVGGAITQGSKAESEYQECLLKAKAMRQVLEQES